MDFITELQGSDGFNAVLMAIDRITKMAHFITCIKDMEAQQFHETFLKEII